MDEMLIALSLVGGLAILYCIWSVGYNRGWSKGYLKVDLMSGKGETMSIILEGIDLPIETDYLRLALFRSGRDNEILVFDDATNTLIGKAIQIPKGHGKLIDEKELKTKIHDVTLEGGVLHGCIDKTVLHEVPTILAEEG